MTKFKRFMFLCAILLMTTFAYGSVYSNDAFVLVDVSGTMNNSKANIEAKSIIQDLLLGDFDYPKWQAKGWNKNNKDDVLPLENILKQESHFCLIPFGNMNRVHDYKKHVFQNESSFISFYESSFPTSFKDNWTYLTLAKAYVGSIAVTYKINKAYVFIYTDGRPESTKEPYDNFNQQIVDDLDYAGSNSFKKIGILRKNSNSKFHFDVEIWEFTSYKTKGVVPSPIDTTEIKDPSVNTPISRPIIKITIPTDGKYKSSPHKATKNEELKLRWTGGSGNVIVHKKEGDKYKRIPANKSSEIFKLTNSGTNASMTFFESADYKIEVRGTNGGRDEMFLSITTPLFPIILRLIIIIGILAALIYSYFKYFGSQNNNPHNDNWGDNNTDGKRNSMSSTTIGNEDW